MRSSQSGQAFLAAKPPGRNSAMKRSELRYFVLAAWRSGGNRSTNVQFCTKFNRRTTVEFSTEPAILPNCWLAVVHWFSVVIVMFVHLNWIFFKIASCNEFCC